MTRTAATLLTLTLLAPPALRAQAPAIRLWPGAAPGSEHWDWTERDIPGTPLGTVIFDVVTPTLTVYRPPAGTANGTAMIVAPGGGFVALAIDVEGRDLAKWLTARGVTVFLLKYRLVKKTGDGIPDLDADTAARYGIADATQAVRVVRAQARRWGVDPHRVGIIGFSAGGMIASGALLAPDPATRPDFAAMIYGAPFSKMPAVPAGLPPTFLAWAKDDPIASGAESRFAAALDSAGDHPSVHLYATGGHGFGLKHQGTESDRWIADFERWLRTAGFLGRK